jgi:hypothetical protein
MTIELSNGLIVLIPDSRNIDHNREAMKKINYLVLLIFALTMSVSSCSKYESTSYEGLSTREKTKELLTSKSWVKSYLRLNEDTIALADCEEDDVYTFMDDGTVLYHVDLLICGGETDGSGTWSLSSDGKSLTLDGISWSIEITEDRLTLSMYHFDDDSFDETIFIPL